MAEFGTSLPLESGWVLEGTDGAGKPLRLSFGKTELGRAYLGVVVGRHPLVADRVLADPSVSRRHFRLGLASGVPFIEDLNSLNGTQLDGAVLTPFQPAAVGDGQRIVCGNVSLVLRSLSRDPDRLRTERQA